ncbi:hypothetical protein CPHO_11295 [Corynebacterium phocae]|uniref:Uncharacterized protein n=1 Tax=Corynebacterium phocae TaxID=161895 RepID=A0A1L7D5V4_9CORY|nr:hypothetical protein CPHO_11295 [Corynebacterium phocae]
MSGRIFSNELEGKAAAESFRRKNGLGTGPIHDLIKVIEDTTTSEVVILSAPTDCQATFKTFQSAT